tara:strand:+ start:321 stop:752 length:432 start_codon:yes stop_codon:yes gene_type:complete
MIIMRKIFFAFIFFFIYIGICLADNTSEKKIVYVCQLALNDTNDGWSNEWIDYVKEAKLRGFSPSDCYRIWRKESNKPIELQDELGICQLASNKNWNGWDDKWPKYVKEAKRRGLSPSDCSIIGYGDKFPFGKNILPPDIEVY